MAQVQNDPQKHHVIPWVYLKNFTDSDNLMYRCKFREQFQPKFLSTIGKMGLGWLSDYFRYEAGSFDVKNAMLGPLHIEIDINGRFERTLPEVLSSVIDKSPTITLKQKFKIAELIDHIKFRSTVIRKKLFNKESLIQMAKDDSIFDVFPEFWAKAKEDLGDKYHDFVESIKDQTIKEIQDNDDSLFHNRTIVNEDGEPLKGITRELIYGFWEILETSNDHPFITGDNPGYIGWDRKKYASFWDAPFEFYFPISSTLMLFVARSPADFIPEFEESLKFTNISEDEVNKINISMGKNSDTFIYSISADMLVFVREKIKEQSAK